MSILSSVNLCLSYESTNVVEDLSLTIPEGKVSSLIGANGSGKSTILKSYARILKPKSGYVYLNGENIRQLATKQVAKKLAILPQGPVAPEGLTVKDLCYYGRHPHKGLLSKHLKKDHDMVMWALNATRMEEFSERTLDELSGGQRQRAWIAMALCQDTEILLLDEPTTYLDVAHQIDVLEILRDLNHEYGKTIVMVLHDLNQAARYSDYLISILNGEVYKKGLPEEVFTEKMILDVFGLKCHILKDPVEGSLLCVPLRQNVIKSENKIII